MKIVKERGATLVPPFDDPLIIAGQGTIGVEIVEDLAKLDLKPEIVVVGGDREAGWLPAFRSASNRACRHREDVHRRAGRFRR